MYKASLYFALTCLSILVSQLHAFYIQPPHCRDYSSLNTPGSCSHLKYLSYLSGPLEEVKSSHILRRGSILTSSMNTFPTIVTPPHNLWPVLLCPHFLSIYSRPVNNTGLNYVGKLIYGFFLNKNSTWL